MMEEPDAPPVLVKQGDTPIHAHDDFEVVLKPILTEFYMTPSEQRPYTWKRFAELLDQDFQLGLREKNSPGDYLRMWCKRYLASSWSLTPQMVRKRVAEAEADIVTAIEHEQQAEALKEDIEERRSVTETEDGPVTLASLSEIASARKKVSELKEKRDEELERWGVIPPKKAKKGDGSGINVEAEEFSLTQHFEQASGRDRAKELDADGEVH